MIHAEPPNHGGQSITIGLRDLYDQMQTLVVGYQTLSTKLDTALLSHTLAQQTTAAQLADIRSINTDQEMRLRVLEARPYISPRTLTATIALITSVLGTVFSIIQFALAH